MSLLNKMLVIDQMIDQIYAAYAWVIQLICNSTFQKCAYTDHYCIVYSQCCVVISPPDFLLFWNAQHCLVLWGVHTWDPLDRNLLH